ncbi:hypothetical protein BS47DRAFT_1335205 [Hydnum rufescens UP504]|uniref:Transmembrane protein n=1 Tax=Hydnum rufescens UP504 TaxID=1448309 RepID=A0A9P6BBQ3_9AGAM|nr:hypothetical protein BS47DRAFT_1335205 [Hydnum rufescens UP504]
MTSDSLAPPQLPYLQQAVSSTQNYSVISHPNPSRDFKSLEMARSSSRTSPLAPTSPSGPSAPTNSTGSTKIGRFFAIFLPSLRPAFKDAYKDALVAGQKRAEPRFKAKDNLQKLFNQMQWEEFQALHVAAHPGDLATPNDIRRDFLDFMARAKATRAVRQYLTDVTTELNDIEKMVASKGYIEQTAYTGLADWATDAWNAYQYLINAITAVCILGAGLTYAAIFSAIRGNIGYMCWSFSLFVIGLILTTTTQTLLTWCMRLRGYPFSAQSFWEFVLGSTVCCAVGSVTAAMCILMRSVQELNYSGNLGTDSPPVFTTDPRPPAFLAFSTLGTGLFITFLLFILMVLWRRSLYHLIRPQRSLNDYPAFVTELKVRVGRPHIDDLVDII